MEFSGFTPDPFTGFANYRETAFDPEGNQARFNQLLYQDLLNILENHTEVLGNTGAQPYTDLEEDADGDTKS